ncbi:MAG: ammonium transporter [Acidibacillus sp.]|uniref:Ammonium transporter n=1 Tax=Sulfoacidibacillus ferrooxidans TaxID=2005001 RepID=A0A9X1V5H5_9BACL|nr:ammonium transporter [Sulfoacidibacillus ferrooxidans]MCI0181881.1 Ammonium transporter [Sulfoacidibacillus ferrooxidans]MCY0892822.1 ammonium transporter [Acidibacillus sp.]
MPILNSGDIAWILASSALVLVMTPGLAFFYGGLVRNKNVITTLYQVFAVMLIVSVQWVVFGYSLAFGPDVFHVIGDLQWAFFNHVGAAPDPNYAPTIPNELYGTFQMMFAIITPALIVGGLAERVKFSSFLVFITLWATFIYDPLAHWVWGVGGWLHNMGILDFAGGTVVHISSGISGLICAMYLGKRAEHGSSSIKAHNVPMVLLGVSLLWFGWFGFNAGSAVGANQLAVNAFLVTNTATAAAALAWMLVERLMTGHATLVGASAGAVTGLVAITPACGYVNIEGSLIIGALGGVICYFSSTLLKGHFGYDDALDAFGGHGIGGTWGAIATGLFATVSVNSGGGNGLFYGNPHQAVVQLIGVAATWAFSAIGTFILLKLVDVVMGLRVTAEEEKIGLDVALHNENAYPETLTWDVASSILGSLKRPNIPSELHAEVASPPSEASV